MQIVIDISKDRYDEIMSMDWKNCRRFFDEEIRAIHDGKALEQEPCEVSQGLVKDSQGFSQEPCGDCISRQEVLDINEHHHGQMPNHVNHEIWKEIKALPPVTPQQKRGCWIYHDGYIPYKHECSECGKRFGTDFNYCPNCGAKM